MKFRISLLVVVSIITILFTASISTATENFSTLREKITSLQERLASAGVEVNIAGLDDTQAEQVINSAINDYVAKRDAQAAQDRSAVEAAIQEQVSILKAKLQDVGVEVNTDGLGAEEAHIKMRTAYNEYISESQSTQPVAEQTTSVQAFNTEEYIKELQKKLNSVGVEVNTEGMSVEDTLIALRIAYSEYISASQSK